MKNETKHTPGPWYHDVNEGAIFAGNSGITPIVCVTRTESYGEYHQVSGPEAAANFNVIAAAPDMLEALERLSIAAETFASSDSDMPSHAETEREFESALESAKAAIAKAKGGR